jgi:hypothetical protein
MIMIMWRIPIATQQLGKHIPATQAHATIEYPLLGSGQLNMHPWEYRLCFPWGPCRGVIKGQRRSLEEHRTFVESSRVVSSLRNCQLQNNGVWFEVTVGLW